MQTYCEALPILPGKRDVLMQFIKDISGPMKKDFERAEKHLGIKKEALYLRSSPQGDWLLVYMETNDVARTFGDFAVSKDPFEVLARNTIKEFTGIDFSIPPQGTPPAQLFSYGY